MQSVLQSCRSATISAPAHRALMLHTLGAWWRHTPCQHAPCASGATVRSMPTYTTPHARSCHTSAAPALSGRSGLTSAVRRSCSASATASAMHHHQTRVSHLTGLQRSWPSTPEHAAHTTSLLPLPSGMGTQPSSSRCLVPSCSLSTVAARAMHTATPTQAAAHASSQPSRPAASPTSPNSSQLPVDGRMLSQPTMVVVIGVDPDTHGSVSVASWVTTDLGQEVDVSQLQVQLFDTPTALVQLKRVKKGKAVVRRWLDVIAAKRMIDQVVTRTMARALEQGVEVLELRAFVESTPIMPFTSSARTLSTQQYSVGAWHGLLVGCGFHAATVPASVWKRDLGLVGCDKEASRGMALALFPGKADVLGRKKDHGRAEGLLISAWGCGAGLAGRSNVWQDPTLSSSSSSSSSSKRRRKAVVTQAEHAVEEGEVGEGPAAGAAGVAAADRSGMRVPLPGSPHGLGVQLLWGSLRMLGATDGYGNAITGTDGEGVVEEGEEGGVGEVQPPKRATRKAKLMKGGDGDSDVGDAGAGKVAKGTRRRRASSKEGSGAVEGQASSVDGAAAVAAVAAAGSSKGSSGPATAAGGRGSSSDVVDEGEGEGATRKRRRASRAAVDGDGRF